MKLRSLITTVIASSMIVAPVAAQAGTKASSMVAPVAYGSHTSSKVTAMKEAFPLIFIVIGLVGVATVTVAVVEAGKS